MNLIKKLLMGLGILALAFIGIGIVAVNSKPPSGQVDASASAPVAVPYETSVKQLLADYRANEVQTDQKIASRAVRITGTIQAIEKDFMGKPVVTLVTDNEFMPARMTLDAAQLDQAAKLSRGQLLTLTCEDMRFLLGSPTGGSCRL